MADEETIAQFALSEEERELIQKIRRSEADASDPRLQLTLELSLYAGSRYLGSYDIEATRMVSQFAHYGTLYLEKVLRGLEPEEQSEGGNGDFQLNDGDSILDTLSILEEQPDAGNESVQLKDSDSILDTQSTLEDNNTADNDDKKPISRHAIREELVPSYVKDIIFTASREAVSPACEEQLRIQFPGVIVTRDCSKVEHEEDQEVDEMEQEEDQKAAATEKPKYAWTSTEFTQGPIKKLADLVQYATHPPTDHEFGFNFPLGEIWDTLPESRKLDIAHARAIQGRYGKTVDGPGCSQCIAEGYECKVYHQQLEDLSHIGPHGHACQNCRLRGTACDTSAAAEDRPTSSLTGDKIDPTDNTQESNLASNVSLNDLGSHIGDVDTSGRQDEIPPESEESRESGSLDLQVTNSLTADPIMKRALSIGLDLSKTDMEETLSLYRKLRASKVVSPSEGDNVALEHQYKTLTTLYILAPKEIEKLRDAVLLEFQRISCYYFESLPGIETTVLAFKHLPTHSRLCKWIAILYASRWRTQEDGEYEAFVQDHPNLDSSALWRLFYAMRNSSTQECTNDAKSLKKVGDIHGYAEDNRKRQAVCNEMQFTLTKKLKKPAFIHVQGNELRATSSRAKRKLDCSPIDALNPPKRKRCPVRSR
ncbi:uncharacterized protein K460DRAFT_393914 [Cucurbitaria berberidis CBS 394.84]|uniref:Uncharacterized protein n=1 Tax=Cucurbitaria berberidis CBS 394.84 TaxID=1168544 RepID=A0A9P4GPV7_9PLEO|nr:uncharacterized protein K460DRAFT_393914 [Cucurbitaria berberidis CBS 394.84]KAF1848966.1 hypothetical protein K460DRAFT_393914 [Cucurbitaria berberidis CBS 394.84]